MATDRVNLLPPTLGRQKSLGLGQALAGGWAVSLIGVVAATSLVIRDARGKEALHADLARQAASLNTRIQEYAVQTTGADLARSQVDAADKVLAERIRWTEAFKELSLLVPKAVWLTNLASRSDEKSPFFLELVGEAPSQRQVASFVEGLEHSLYFSKATLVSSQRREDFAPVLYRFSIQVDLPGVGSGKPAGGADGKKAAKP